ncbi:hypothetical protein CLLI_15190 [Clostridium liquoris]|uniref:Baseplate upper protein immunoglobulin like domain-containing protein n=1 Tax=Clostridium liquoris TaxID=1289519 RepID=A0A2T0B3H8_9CLOT|nr:hypothetical protein [Clostridium liquoris]PRR78435.1 hypothetical protein CLLI_15190 [Clostridium liquoris]
MERSAFFNSINGDRRYKAEVFAEYFSSFIGNGVFSNPNTSLQARANDDMTMTLSPGKAWINGYFYMNTDDLILIIDPADGVLSRVDRVVLRFDVEKRNIKAIIKKGEFSANPEPPLIQRDADIYELGLADIKVNQGAISITQEDIIDLRLNKSLCGIVHGLIDQVDTTEIFNQFQGWYKNRTSTYMKEWENWFYPNTSDWEEDFIEWFNSIKGSLAEDTGTFLSNEVLEIKKNLAELDSVEIASIEHGLNKYPDSLLIRNEYAAGIGGAGVSGAGGGEGLRINHRIIYSDTNAIKVQVPTLYKELVLEEIVKANDKLYYLVFENSITSMTLILN